MNIVPFKQDLISVAAELFTTNFNELRARVPILPQRMADPALIAEKLAGFVDASPAFAALDDDGWLIGYLGAYMVDGFRSTNRKGAYSPEWGHSVALGVDPNLYRALYRAASTEWFNAGCQTHALTLLAHDPAVEKIWFWQGFGLGVVDAIRSMDRPTTRPPTGYFVRQATLDDIPALVNIEAEHWRHYAQPPVFMVSDAGRDEAAFTEFLTPEDNSAWLAVQDGNVLAYLMFKGRGYWAAESVGSETTVSIVSAYTRPAYRGQGAAVSIMDAALQAYVNNGFERCSVDFESFNPEAAHFWLKYFKPVCYSVMRVPEREG